MRELVDGAKLTWPSTKEHPVEIQAVWRITGPAQIDMSLVATPEKPLENFEILVASYAALDMIKGVYVGSEEDPQLLMIRPSPEYGNPENYPFFPLGADARRQQQQSGRFLAKLKWKSHVTAQDAALPLAFADDGKTQLVLIGDPESVSAVCVTATPSNLPPEGWNGQELHSALYLSLFCRDVTAGERCTARARLIVLERPEDSQEAHRELYEEFLSEGS